jgi:hypothetical protein
LKFTFGNNNLFWLQDSNEINGNNLNIRRETSSHFRNKDKINELATNSRSKNIIDLYRGINEFKRGYQHRSNLVKDENGDVCRSRKPKLTAMGIRYADHTITLSVWYGIVYIYIVTWMA